MALAAITTEAPKGFEEHYTKLDDGRFRLNVEASDGYALEDISGLKSALSKERATEKPRGSLTWRTNPAEARKATRVKITQAGPRARSKLAQPIGDHAQRRTTKAVEYEQRTSPGRALNPSAQTSDPSRASRG